MVRTRDTLKRPIQSVAKGSTQSGPMVKRSRRITVENTPIPMLVSFAYIKHPIQCSDAVQSGSIEGIQSGSTEGIQSGVISIQDSLSEETTIEIESEPLSQPSCGNPLCDHQRFSDNIHPLPARFADRSDVLKDLSLDDLISLGKAYHCNQRTHFNSVSLKKLCALVGPLTKLSKMVGMMFLKKDIIEQVIGSIQGIEDDIHQKDLLHSIIEGPPGVGKTHVVEILAEIYGALGYTKTNVIKKVKRSDLIGKYLGHTAKQTQAAIDSADGGILLIDEAYSLGNKEKRDSFSKECIDTLNQNLTERVGQFICIVVGYEKDLDECFFSYNPGLRSRFSNKYTIDPYNSTELEQIFDQKLSSVGWSSIESIDPKRKSKLFALNMPLFNSYGRSMELLVRHSKIAHQKRMFWEADDSPKRMLTLDDIANGLIRYKSHCKPTPIEDKPPVGMYQ